MAHAPTSQSLYSNSGTHPKFRITAEKIGEAAHYYKCTQPPYIRAFDKTREYLTKHREDESGCYSKLVQFTQDLNNRTNSEDEETSLDMLRQKKGRQDRLEDSELPCTIWQEVQEEFEAYCKDIGPVGASKFLGVLHPQLCVMWDNSIRVAYGHRSSKSPQRLKPPQYCCFLYEMHRRAIEIESESPGLAAFLSGKLYNGSVEYSLATFINQYLWVTFSMSKNADTPCQGHRK